MSDIFISYAKTDRETARMLSGALEATGCSVFWDREVPPGRTWRDYIGQELEQARCMIVLWSKASVASHWVLEEAEVGRERNILVPVRVDDAMPPLGFQSLQAADLSGWDGTPQSPAFKILVAAVKAMLGPAPVVEEGPPATDVGTVQTKEEEVRPSEPTHQRFPWRIVVVSSAVLLIAAAGVWRVVVGGGGPPFPITVEKIRERVEPVSVESSINGSAEDVYYSNIGFAHIQSDHVVCSCVGRLKSSVTVSEPTIKPEGKTVLIRFKSGAVLVPSLERVRETAECSFKSSGPHPSGTQPASDAQKNNLRNQALSRLVEDANKKTELIVVKTTKKVKASLTEFAGSLGYQATIVFDEPVLGEAPSS